MLKTKAHTGVDCGHFPEPMQALPGPEKIHNDGTACGASADDEFWEFLTYQLPTAG